MHTTRRRRGYEKDTRTFSGSANLEWISVRAGTNDEIPAYIGGGASQLYGRGLCPGTTLRQPVRAGESAKTAADERISGRTAAMLLAGLCAILFAFLLIRAVPMWEQRRTVAAVTAEVNEVTRRNSKLSASLEEKEAAINVSYEAARRGMVSSKSVSTVRLTVPAAGLQYTADRTGMQPR